MSHIGHLGQLGQQWVESGQGATAAHTAWTRETSGQRSGQGEGVLAVPGRAGQLGGTERRWASFRPAAVLLQGHSSDRPTFLKDVCDLLFNIFPNIQTRVHETFRAKTLLQRIIPMKSDIFGVVLIARVYLFEQCCFCSSKILGSCFGELWGHPDNTRKSIAAWVG